MADFPINQILSTLNNASIQQKQPAIYQAIYQLIQAAKSNQTTIVTTQASVQSQLSNSLTYGTAADRNTYKPQTTAGNLVFYFETDTELLYVFANNAWYLVSGDFTATYLTVTDETAILVNSRREVAGTGISFDDSVPGVRTVNSTVTANTLSPFLLMGA